jgi:2-dehydropantoate 2-reductase
MRERVAVLGPGAVGAALAVPLALASVDVVCIARPATARTIRSEGLTLRRGQKDLTARAPAVEELGEAVDLLLVTVKAPGLDDGLRRVQAPATTVVPLLNGIEHMQTIRAALPESAVVAGSIGLIEAYLDRPGTIVQNTPALIVTLASDAEPSTAELLRRARADVRVDGSEAHVLWEKLARQAPIAAATALTQRSIGELRADPEWRPRLEAAIEETCAVAAQDGVELAPAVQWEIIDALPPQLTTSTARDVAAGRPSELDAIAGAAVRAGRRNGVPTPALESLLAEAEDMCRVQSA